MKLLHSLFLAALLAVAMLVATPVSSPAAGPNPVVVFETNMGRFMVMLEPKLTPVTVKNFLTYVNSGFYNNTIFHRVVKQKKTATDESDTSLNVIQGGGFTWPLRQKKTNPPIINESSRGLSNDRGTIAMARSGAPNSATSQFFINVKDNPMLNYHTNASQTGVNSYSSSTNPGYCAFGKVIRGMDVVEKIHNVATARHPGGMDDVPVKPVVITRAYVAK